MRSALVTVGGIVFALGLLGCHTPVKRPATLDGRGLAPPPPRLTDLRGEAAKTEITARNDTGGVASTSSENGITTTRIKYPDGAVASFSTGGPNGTEYEFHPAN